MVAGQDNMQDTDESKLVRESDERSVNRFLIIAAFMSNKMTERATKINLSLNLQHSLTLNSSSSRARAHNRLESRYSNSSGGSYEDEKSKLSEFS